MTARRFQFRWLGIRRKPLHDWLRQSRCCQPVRCHLLGRRGQSSPFLSGHQMGSKAFRDFSHRTWARTVLGWPAISVWGLSPFGQRKLFGVVDPYLRRRQSRFQRCRRVCPMKPILLERRLCRIAGISVGARQTGRAGWHFERRFMPSFNLRRDRVLFNGLLCR